MQRKLKADAGCWSEHTSRHKHVMWPEWMATKVCCAPAECKQQHGSSVGCALPELSLCCVVKPATLLAPPYLANACTSW